MRSAEFWLLAAMLALVVFAQLANGLNADVSWLLTVGERMLSGQRLYTDIQELNPPMSALLYLPVVWASHGIGVAPEWGIILAILLSVLAACAFARRVLDKNGLVLPRPFWLIVIGALTLLPGSNFGEREHIAVIVLIPLLATAWCRSTGRRPGAIELILVGCAGGLAMAIKPHFALTILLMACHGAWRTRTWRPILNAEHVIGGAILLGYWTSVWALFPEFISTMLPLASAAYLADRAPTWLLLLQPQLLLSWLLLIGLLVVYRKQGIREGLNPQLLAAAAGFFLAYLIQGKGFTYHLLPSITLLSIAFAGAFLARNGTPGRFGFAEALALLLVVSPGLPSLKGDPLRGDILAALAPLGPGLSIANITSELELASPLHRMVVGTLVNSGPCLWITLGAKRINGTGLDEQKLAYLQRSEDMERARLRQDMLANPPDIILAGAGGFDWLAWARLDPQLALLLNEYKPLSEVGTVDRSFTILRRSV